LGVLSIKGSTDLADRAKPRDRSIEFAFTEAQTAATWTRQLVRTAFLHAEHS
jgi:hypothetical protein